MLILKLHCVCVRCKMVLNLFIQSESLWKQKNEQSASFPDCQTMTAFKHTRLWTSMSCVCYQKENAENSKIYRKAKGNK